MCHVHRAQHTFDDCSHASAGTKRSTHVHRPHTGILVIPNSHRPAHTVRIAAGIGKILFERIAFPIHIPSAEVDCIPTRNPLFSLGL